ncbi:DoxX family protein [Flavobacterium columnare]|uniref:DoxX family protein n=2 Tax=Flavobacterium TaxID=237 RepID=A0AA94JNU2_9FLAO|nr:MULTISPECIES: DoxX family protein [Flavobacterium]OXA81021.1 DoxX family membrane protein [Flavobacterium columnare NBRC 100251 = ATCC 23463]AMA49308.1 DoxX family protein [Flavobacterium covae]AND63008.1 DoxX family protein [Flavobacterium covae]ANO48148.1 DoxX family protein [Flavobacterium columnare]APT21283.1 DoxX family membrane protein [Flavobacterium columnare]
METVKNLNKWANAHTYYSLDLLRIFVGIFLFMKGVSFMTNTLYYTQLIEPIKNFGGGMLIVHYVMAAHIMGGIMIVFGLLTRWSIIAQIPILLGAFLINFIDQMNPTNLILSFFLLCVCAFFLFYGSGKHSADYYFKMGQ